MRGTPILAVVLLLLTALAHGDETGASVYPDMPAGSPPPVEIPEAVAADPAQMKAYTERIAGTEVTFDLVPIPGGTFVMGSPANEPGRADDEGPQVEVRIAPFWMGRCEVTWDEYLLFQSKLDVEERRRKAQTGEPQDAWADAVSRPTLPYRPMDFDMGVGGYPAISMTQFAARHYTKWLSMKTGRFYRLPTEAEWEYACRAGTKAAYSFGDDPAYLDAYAWYFDNSDDAYHKVGEKRPNPWGLHDMHGNVAEWVLDQYLPGFYAAHAGAATDPVAWPTTTWARVVRGGSWDDDPERLRSAARRVSTAAWQQQDPQLPKSIWYLTDAPFVGFRVVRPLADPSDADKARAWEPDTDDVREILLRQRTGAR